MSSNITFRTQVQHSDMQSVKDIVESTNFFYDHEIEVAVELVIEALESKGKSDYHFIFAEIDGKTVGYTCFGPIACTKASYDIYWIAVHNDYRNQKIGKIILEKTENAIKEIGGKGIYLETSSLEKYHPTREFYIRCNYTLEAQIKDFYDTGDDKAIYVKRF
jgi:ribosomal protein S18 acetylase RimI-like enzyme